MMFDWANTPGACYAFAYWLSASLIIYYSPRSMSLKKAQGINVIFGLVLLILMSVTHGLSIWLFAPLMSLFVLIMWMAVQTTCSYDVKTSIYVTARVFIGGEFIAALEWHLFYYAMQFHLLPASRTTEILFAIAVDVLLVYFLHFLEKRNEEINQTLNINYRELLSALIIALAVYIVSNINYVFNNMAVAGLILSQLFLVRTLIDLGGVAILFAYHVQLGELNLRYEMEHLQTLYSMQQQNYEVLEQSVNTINQKYHDLKYQIAVLKSEASAEESLRYLDKMEQEIKAYEAQNKTGNKVLDTILTGKSLYCQNNWIELTSVADGSALDFMDPMDISTLFGNMLDNAIESVSKIEHKERRLIHVAIARQKGFLRIRVENCFDEKPEFKNGLPTTTKSDKRYHGFGLKSIRNTVKKYGGSTTISAENGWFELRILIPITTQKTPFTPS